MTFESRGEMIEQFVIATSTKPPVESVPILMALQWLLMTQLLTSTFSQGRFEVLFRQTASSSLSMKQFETMKSRQPSMSTPSTL